MSSRAWPTETPLSRLFPFTLWGAVLTALAGGLLAVGALRGELASLLWGSSFLLLALYSLSGSHLYALLLRRHLRRRPDPLDCTLPARGVFPGQEAEAHVSAEMPRLGVPGFHLGLLLPLRFHGRAPLDLRCSLRRGSTAGTFRLLCPHRGSYSSSRALIVIEDRLGFTRAVVGMPLQETLRVYPSVGAPALPRPPAREGGERPQRRRRQRPNHEELLEVRRYFPGDDIRRLHWKVFAHTRELFLRVGEDSPPPSSRFLVLLDVCPSPVVPATLAADHLDGLVAACLAAIQALQPAPTVLFALSRDPAAQAVGREAFSELLSRLAAVWWDDRLAFRAAPADRGLQALLFSTPGSANLPRLVRALTGQDCAVLLLLKGLPEPRPPRPSPGGASWRTLVLREPRPAGRSRDGARRAFDQAMQAALDSWRRRLGGTSHARRI